MLDAYRAAESEGSQSHGEEAHDGLGDQEQAALRVAVGQDAAVEAEQQHRPELERRGATARPEPVRVKTSQSWAMRHQVPLFEMAAPMKYRR